jgi:hypothetical protein
VGRKKKIEDGERIQIKTFRYRTRELPKYLWNLPRSTEFTTPYRLPEANVSQKPTFSIFKIHVPWREIEGGRFLNNPLLYMLITWSLRTAAFM